MIIYTDGACSGNPGPMGAGIAIYDGEKLLKKISKPLGKGTNNIAEYTAVKIALEEAKAMGAKGVEIRTDSHLIVQQLRGEFRIKVPHLRKIKVEIDALAKDMDVRYVWVEREQNLLADALSKEAAGSK
ncbi:MAG: ribonuclease HI family protein [Candidatus Bilamarchaeaceae archaeon]